MNHNQDQNGKRRHLFLKVCNIFVHFQPILPTLLFVRDPFNTRYWPVRFEKMYANHIVLQYSLVALGFLLDVVASIFSIFPSSFILAMLMIYFGKLNFCLQILKSDLKRWGPSEHSLKKYKILALINQFAFSCLSNAILPLVYSMAHIFTTVVLASLLKRGSRRDFEAELNCCCALFILIVVVNTIIMGAGEIVTRSQQIKHIFTRTVTKRNLRKSILACRDIRIYFNSVFFMEKETFTVYLNSVIDNTITLVLAT